MKIFLIFILISSAISTKKLTEIKDDQLLSTVIADVINELFTRHELKFETFIFEKVSNHVYDVINGLKNGQFHTTISSMSSRSVWETRLTSPAVIFCESLDILKNIIGNYVGDKFFPRNFKFLFYIEEPFNVTKIGVEELNSYISRMSWFSYFIFKHKSRFNKVKHFKQISMNYR